MRLPFLHINPARLVYLRRLAVEWGSIALLVALIVVPLGMLAWLVLFTDTFEVRAITIVDARDHTAEEVRILSQDLLERNILAIQTPVLERQVITNIPQIRDVHIVRKLPDTLKIIVQEKTPALLLLSNTQYYFVDEEGIVYEEARLDTLPGIVLPVVKNNDPVANVTLGSPAVSPEFVQFVLAGQQKLPDLIGAQVAEIRIPSLAAREVHVLFDTNWLVRFDSTRSLDSQLSILQRLLEHTISEEDRAILEYIDLRIPNRVYYKTRTGQSAPRPTPTTE